jgi:hypothetical protein
MQLLLLTDNGCQSFFGGALNSLLRVTSTNIPIKDYSHGQDLLKDKKIRQGPPERGDPSVLFIINCNSV